MNIFQGVLQINNNNFSYRCQGDKMQNKARSKSSHQHKKYQKFANDIYTCIRQKQSLIKRCCTPDNDNFPRLLNNGDQTLGLCTIEELALNETKYIKNPNHNHNHNQTKSIKFKNFLNALDQHQKKVSVDNMNLLGLEVKKINYCEKAKRMSEKHLGQFFDQNMCASMRDDQNIAKCQTRKTLNYQQSEDFGCQKIGLSYREPQPRPKPSKILTKTNFFRTKSRPATQSEQKRRTCPQFQNPVYDNRITKYRQLIFKLNFAHGVYIETQKDLAEEWMFKNQMKYKAWVGAGNNGSLIKELIKRRFWWQLVEDKSLGVNFMWTQLKVQEFFNLQVPSGMWVKDTSKYWGKPPQQDQPTKNIKRRLQKFQKQPTQQDYHFKIFTDEQQQKYKQFNKKLSTKSYLERSQYLQLTQHKPEQYKIHNHLPQNFYLGNKKALFYNLKQYYQLLNQNPFTRIPLTFHIKKGFKDENYKKFIAYFKKRQMLIKKVQKQEQEKKEKKKMRNVWIVKPGELTNRGNGITVIDQVYQLNQIIKKQGKHQNGTQKTFIVQLYIDRPLLYQRRKFDIRHYMLITHIHGLMRAYWYKEGYIRTSSYEFDIENFQREIHLTNDAVQKYTPHYGRYEAGNKLSYSQFQRYLDATHPKKNYNFQEQILPEMKQICLDAVKSSYLKLSPQRLKHNFQFFGLDFMIDQNFKPWLIQINTNPCLQLSAPLLARIIPQAVDQALRLSLDIVFPPPCHYPNTSKHLAPQAGLSNLNYELIFDQKRDGAELRALYRKSSSNDLLDEIGNISEDQTFQDDGKAGVIDQLL